MDKQPSQSSSMAAPSGVRMGLINTVAGKGCFVAEPDLALFREQSLHLLEDHLAAAAELARTCGLSESELAELLRRKWEGSL